MPEATTSQLDPAVWLRFAPWLAAIYAIGVVLMLLRLFAGILQAHRLACLARPIVEGPLLEMLQNLSRQWSLRVVPLLAKAEHVVVPKVVGLFKPTILLPASALAGLSTGELEMILMHELAHVRRHDLWVNLLQRLAEVALFFNPPLWVLSRRIGTLREYCCDEMTCRTQSASGPETQVRYASALLRIVELGAPKGVTTQDLATLAASGRAPSELRRRVARLFGEPLQEPIRISRGGLLTLISLGAALTIGPSMWNTRAEVPEDRAGSETIVNAKNNDLTSDFQLHVIGPDGTPVPNASVEIRTSPAPTAKQIRLGKYVRAGNYGTFATTDAQGRLTVTLSGRPKRFNLSIKQPGYGPYWAGWDSGSHPQNIPLEFTAQLDAGWSVGGVVVNRSGQPLEGVSVDLSVFYKKRPGDTEQLGVGTHIETDAQGKWRFNHVPDSLSDIHISLNHSDYRPLRMRLPRSGFEVQLGTTPTARIELKRGLSISGKVTDESGAPIVGALVRTKFLNDLREARTDGQGTYRLVGCEPRMARIVVSAQGCATDMQEVRVDSEMEPVNFSMVPGGKIRIRVVDEQGNGIPKARIFFQRWRGRTDYFEFDHVSQFADENGVWEWNEAPLDSFQADICRPGGMQLSRQPLIAREEEYVFKPPRALVISGSVVDAKTKKPIQKFRVIPGLRNSDPRIGMNWIPRDSFEASAGEYRIRLTHAYPAHLVRIEAEGYQVAISRDIMTDEGEVDLDFELQSAQDIAAAILSASGEPAANAKIALGVAGSQISIKNGDIDRGQTYATRLDADAKGQFGIPARDEPFQLVITHPLGFAHLNSTDGPIPNPITLTPWARVEGTFRVGAEPAPNVVMSLSSEGIHSYGDKVPNIFTQHKVTTGKEGRFVFERVFPGKGRIGRRILLMVNDGATEVTSSLMVSAQFSAGETVSLELGGSGRPVAGKLAPPADYSGRVLWNFALVDVKADIALPPRPTPPAEAQGNPDRIRAWWEAWRWTDAGMAWTNAYETSEQLQWESPVFRASVDRDGSFRIDDVPEGNYVLSVRFSKDSAGKLSGYRFSVPPVEAGGVGERMELGPLTLKSQ